MADDTESAVAAWLDNPNTKREIVVARRKLAQAGSNADPVLFALAIELLAAFEIYSGADEPSPNFDESDDETEEPWR